MKVKYPNPSINKAVNRVTYKHASLGMIFESAINDSNEYYRVHNVAVIYKKPTPIQVVKVEYPARSKAKIVEAYYRTPSTTDYNGVYKGKYIDYEAKETINLSFPFKHIFEHQIKHLQAVDENGGLAFIIIYYKKINEVYIIDIKDFVRLFKEGYDEASKKSISVETARIVGKQVKIGFAPTIDYLKAVNELYNLK